MARRKSSIRQPTLVLVSVYQSRNLAPRILYDLLLERKPNVNISHRQMPTWKQHVKFIAKKPYIAWYLIRWRRNYVGAIHLTTQNEIGLGILARWRGRDFGPKAIQLLMRKHRRERFLANINPHNEEWICMFRGLGFRIIQNTYEIRQGASERH
jgi:hypothetical protein